MLIKGGRGNWGRLKPAKLGCAFVPYKVGGAGEGPAVVKRKRTRDVGGAGGPARGSPRGFRAVLEADGVDFEVVGTGQRVVLGRDFDTGQPGKVQAFKDVDRMTRRAFVFRKPNDGVVASEAGIVSRVGMDRDLFDCKLDPRVAIANAHH